jgi:hypothetical protein
MIRLMRASDRLRERTAALLRERYAAGCISTDTLGERVDSALRARTVGELDLLVYDLPPARLASRVARGLRARRRGRALRVEWELPVDRRGVVIGRSSSCDLVVGDPTVSRVHADLRLVDGRWRIRDLGSTNGTWLNGARVQEAEVARGDELALGGVRARMR